MMTKKRARHLVYKALAMQLSNEKDEGFPLFYGLEGGLVCRHTYLPTKDGEKVLTAVEDIIGELWEKSREYQ